MSWQTLEHVNEGAGCFFRDFPEKMNLICKNAEFPGLFPTQASVFCLFLQFTLKGLLKEYLAGYRPHMVTIWDTETRNWDSPCIVNVVGR